jgi:hypothetical protein
VELEVLLLEHVIDLLVLFEKARDEARQRAIVAIDQRLKGVLIAGPSLLHEGAIRGSLHLSYTG